jgi:hypothetical protein
MSQKTSSLSNMKLNALLWVSLGILIASVIGSIAHAEVVSLEWDPNSEPDLAGYNMYRSNQSGSGYVRLNQSLIVATTYDDDAPAGQTFYYVCTAVNTADLESGFSNEVPYTTASSICIGDANQDGNISISDAVAISGHISGFINGQPFQLTGDALLAADANQDGNISISDIVRISQHIDGSNPMEPCQ